MELLNKIWEKKIELGKEYSHLRGAWVACKPIIIVLLGALISYLTNVNPEIGGLTLLGLVKYAKNYAEHA